MLTHYKNIKFIVGIMKIITTCDYIIKHTLICFGKKRIND